MLRVWINANGVNLLRNTVSGEHQDSTVVVVFVAFAVQVVAEPKRGRHERVEKASALKIEIARHVGVTLLFGNTAAVAGIFVVQQRVPNRRHILRREFGDFLLY